MLCKRPLKPPLSYSARRANSGSPAAIVAIVDEHGVHDLTAKSVREHLERRAGLDPGSLKPEKARIGEIIDEVLQERL